MSLNKLTETQKGLDLALKIGCDELKCNNLDVAVLDVVDIGVSGRLDAELITARNVTSQEITAQNALIAQTSLVVGDLTYPTTETAGVEYQYPTSLTGTGTLQMLPSLPFLSYGFARASSAGGLVPISSFGSFTEPDTNANLSSLPTQFYTEDPKGMIIVKTGLYRVLGTLRCVRSVADVSNYCALLVNGSSTQQALQVVPSIGATADIAFCVSDYLQLTAGDKLSIGVAGLSGGTVAFSYWKIALEFIK